MPELLNVDELVLKGLIVGGAGSGKTSLFATAADVEEMSPCCVLDFEGGTLSIAHRKDIYRERIRSTAQLEKVFWEIAGEKGVHKDIRSYFIDSGSEFGELALEEVAAKAFDRAAANPNLAQRESIDDVQLKDYGTATKRVRRLFRWFKDLDGKHVLISSLPAFRYPPAPENLGEQEKRKREEAVKLGLIKPVAIEPQFTQKLANAITGFVDFAWFLNVIEKKDEGQAPRHVRQLVTQPVGPLKFIKTRGAFFAQALGAGREVTFEDGTPRIEGVPAMKFVFDLYRSTTVRGAA
jgi:hypothetical protein